MSVTERLRHKSAVVPSDNTLCDEAADEIDRLTRERDEAREALRVFGRHLDSCGDADAYNHAEVAQCGCGFDAALAGTADQPTVERSPPPWLCQCGMHNAWMRDKCGGCGGLRTWTSTSDNGTPAP